MYCRYPEVDTLASHHTLRPHPQRPGKAVQDGYGSTLSLIGHSEEILHQFISDPGWATHETQIAYVSRTSEIKSAEKCLRLLRIREEISMNDLGHHKQIFPGSKITHFRNLHHETGIPYRNMLFFDNEKRNTLEVSTLGVCSVYTPYGMTKSAWDIGMDAFNRLHEDLASKNQTLVYHHEDIRQPGYRRYY